MCAELIFCFSASNMERCDRGRLAPSIAAAQVLMRPHTSSEVSFSPCLLTAHLKGPVLRRGGAGRHVLAHNQKEHFLPDLGIVSVQLIEHLPALGLMCPLINQRGQVPLMMLVRRRRNLVCRYASDGGASRHGSFILTFDLRKNLILFLSYNLRS